MKTTTNQLGAYAFLLACAAWLALNGCHSAAPEGPAASEGLSALNVSELGPPRIDTLFTNRWYFEECHLEVKRSKIPELRGIPNATAWNDSIRVVFDQEILDSYMDWQEYGEEPYKDASCVGCYSDTVAYMRFEFDLLDATDSTLCLKTNRFWHPHGGNGWSSAYRLWNIDVRTGEEIPIPEWVGTVDVAAADNFISDFFGDNGIGGFYECHSCEEPGYIDRLIENHRVGFINGTWVGFEMIWPTTHGHANKQIVKLPFDRLGKAPLGDE